MQVSAVLAVVSRMVQGGAAESEQYRCHPPGVRRVRRLVGCGGLRIIKHGPVAAAHVGMDDYNDSLCQYSIAPVLCAACRVLVSAVFT